MSDKVTFSMTGLRELEAALAELPLATRRRTGLKVLREAAEPLARSMRRKAPVDEGDLQESIDVSTNLAPSQRGDKGALAPVEMYVGPGQHPQAITKEFGTFKEPAQPYARPAWEEEQRGVLDRTGTLLGIEIDAAARRLAARAARGR